MLAGCPVVGKRSVAGDGDDVFWTSIVGDEPTVFVLFGFFGIACQQLRQFGAAQSARQIVIVEGAEQSFN